MEGEGLGERVTCMMSGRHEGRCERGGRSPMKNLEVLLVISSPRAWDCNIQKTASIQLLIW